MTYWNAMFKEWQEMQQNFLNNLPKKLPGLDYPKQSLNPWELPHLQTFLSWGQSAVKQSMELQTNWLEQWAGQMDSTIAVSNESKSEMIDRIQESMESWSENQTELWEYWFNMVEETASSMEDSAVLVDNISSWKSTVEESLGSQSNWLEEWTEKINIEDLTPEELLSVSSKIQETMNGWLELQGELWSQWFDFLNLNDTTTSNVSVATPTNKPAKKKTIQKKSAAKKATPAKAAKKKVAKKKTVQKKSKPATKKLKKDNLEMISGIGPALAKKLNANGIVSFSQIAALTAKEINNLEETIIKFPGRIRREKWVTQAKKFLKDAK